MNLRFDRAPGYGRRSHVAKTDKCNQDSVAQLLQDQIWRTSAGW